MEVGIPLMGTDQSVTDTNTNKKQDNLLKNGNDYLLVASSTANTKGETEKNPFIFCEPNY